MIQPAYRYIITCLLLAVFLFLAVQLGTREKNNIKNTESRMPSRKKLHDRFYEQRQALFIFGKSHPDSAIGKKYELFLNTYNSQGSWLDIELKHDQEISLEEMQGKTVFLLGTYHSNQLLRQISEKLPFQLAKNSFSFNGKSYSDSQHHLSLFYPNPVDLGFGLNILAANDDEYLLAYLKEFSHSLFRGIGDFEIKKDKKSLVFGLFSQVPGQEWQVDKSQLRDFEEEMVKNATTHYQFHFHGMNWPEQKQNALAQKLESAMASAKTFLAVKNPMEMIDYHVYPSFEDKGIMVGNTDFSHVDFRAGAVHTTIRDDFGGDDFSRDARLLLRNELGEPKQKALEIGLSIYLSKNWREKGFEYWASRLYLSENICPISDLLDNQRLQQESQLIMEPMAASLVAYLLDKWGKKNFLKRYKTWQPAATAYQSIAKEWHTYLSKIAESYKVDISADRKNFPRLQGFQKGFCHAHEGYRIYNGYLSKKSDAALVKLAEMKGNSISITPFSYMRDPNKPVFLHYSRRAGSENDESVIHSALTAKSLGMSVMLKPHIWLGQSWPGAIDMQSEADWEKFFDYYYRWIRHYALLAEMYKIESLCVGVELAKATVGHEADWRTIVKKLRGLYSGDMTYAANWGTEFEQVAFWDVFDYIGINCYYPLSKSDAPSDADLKKGAKSIIEKITAVQQKYNKPVFFTEIGFTSTVAPWKQPHETAHGKKLNLEAQARCYETIFSSIYQKPWCRGIYWWKWPSFLDYGGYRDRDFTPNNKPAESVVRKWYNISWK